MKTSVYRSCHCRACRAQWRGYGRSTVSQYYKRLAHRAFRRESKLRLKKGDETLPIISTGYVA